MATRLGTLAGAPRPEGFAPKGYSGHNGLIPSHADVEEWCHLRGDGNVAIRLPDGVLGIDVDVYHDGEKTMVALCGEFGPLPATFFTSSRDDHSGIRFFRTPKELSWNSSAGQGVDIIQHGHRYAMVAPSVHPNGGVYRWGHEGGLECASPPAIGDLPELPTSWVQFLTGSALTAGNGDTQDTSFLRRTPVLGESIVHNRDDTLFRYACRWRHQGLDYEEALVLMRSAWEKCAQPPERDHEFTWSEAVGKLDRAWAMYPAGESVPVLTPLRPSLRIQERRTSYTAQDLLAANFPEPKWAVPGYAAEGLNLLVGAPKIGKSWLALGLAVGVAGTGIALGQIPVETGGVLYLALEDNPRRLAKRLTSLLDGQEPPPGLTFETDWPTIRTGGGDRLRAYLQEHRDTRLVIVDVLAKVRDQVSDKANAYSADYAAAGGLKAIADEYGIALLVLHHVRKSASDDFVTTVSGTNGIAGAADTIIKIDRLRNSSEAKLLVTGRDVEEHAAAVSLEPATGRWLLVDKPVGDFGISNERQNVIALLRATPGLGPTAVAKELGISTNTAKQTLSRMAKANQVMNDGQGHYSVARNTFHQQSPLSPVTTVTQ